MGNHRDFLTVVALVRILGLLLVTAALAGAGTMQAAACMAGPESHGSAIGETPEAGSAHPVHSGGQIASRPDGSGHRECVRFCPPDAGDCRAAAGTCTVHALAPSALPEVVSDGAASRGVAPQVTVVAGLQPSADPPPPRD